MKKGKGFWIAIFGGIVAVISALSAFVTSIIEKLH